MIQNLQKKAKTIHFIGIGGIGVSALAKFMLKNGFKVSGSDIHQNHQTQELAELGANISIGHSIDNINSQDQIIYSLAIPTSNIELETAKTQNIPCFTYPEFLGELTKNYKLIAIAGTHGKTTTTGMLLKLFIDLNLNPNGIIGTTTNILNGENFIKGDSNWFILEACEYHQGFLNLHPDYTIITNIEHDHFDAYPTETSYLEAFQKLIDQTKSQVFLNSDYPLSSKITGSNITEYSSPTQKIELGLPGLHNQTNANGVIKLAEYLSLPMPETLKSLGTFTGTDRRLQLIKTTPEQKIYDDYGHHPTEIKATLQAIKELYPTQKICVIYQPHQFNRTIALLPEFIESFKDFDKVIIPDIYAARDSMQDKEIMPASHFANEIKTQNPNTVYSESIQNTFQNFSELTKNYPIIVIMGAGDIAELAEMIKKS